MRTTTVFSRTVYTFLVLLGLGILCLGALSSGRWPTQQPLSDRVGTTRSIRTDERIDLPLDPTHADAPRPVRQITPVRIAARGDDAQALKNLAVRVAPFEIVPTTQRPDLVWDGAAKTLSERDDVIAYDVAAEDLPACADRLALVRSLAPLVQQGEQAVRLQPEGRSFRVGQRFTLSLPDVQDRTAIVFVITGDGTLQLLYPTRADPITVQSPDISFSADVSEPFGADQIVAMSSTRDIGDFVTALRRLDHRKAAGDVLGLLDALPNGAAKVGTIRIMTQP